MKRTKLSVSLFLTLAFIVMLAVPVWASAPLTDGNIVNFGDTEVPVGTTVKNVLVIGGNTTIEGTISDEVLVINGNLALMPTAFVRDHVIVLGGNLQTEEGAHIGKGVLRIGGDFAFAGTLVAAGAVVIALWIINVVITAVLLLWPGIMARIWRHGVEDVSTAIRSNLMKAVVVGVLGLMSMFVLIVMLAISIIGIPVAVLVILVTIVMLAAGIGGVCHALGQHLPLLPEQDKASTVRVTFCGAAMSALLFNVPVIGCLALFMIGAASLGGIMMTLFRKKRTT